jgi:hypothetical protein
MIDPLFETRIHKEVERRQQLRQRVSQNWTQDTASRLARNARLGPNLSPRTLLSATANNASPDTIELMNASAQNLSRQNDAQKETDDMWRGIFNPLLDTVNKVKDTAYGALKTTSRYATALGESGSSFVNNYLFERGPDGRLPQGPELVLRLGKLLALPIAGTFALDRQNFMEAAKYTEFGTLLRDPEKQGSGFFLSSQLQYEQMLNTLGIDPDGGRLKDYSGRAYFADARVEVPLPELRGKVQTMAQPATIGAFITNAWGAKMRPDGSIVDGKGLDLDSGVGSFVSGTLDALVELVTDPTIVVGKTIGAGVDIIRSAKEYAELSTAAKGAIAGDGLLEKLVTIGNTIDDLPSTSRSWSEIKGLRKTFANEVEALDAAVGNGTMSQTARDALVQMKESVLTQAETDVWNADRLSEMIRTDSRFGWIFNMVDSARQKYGNVDEAAFAIRNKIFRNRISLEDARRLAEANGPDEYRAIFLEAADALGRGQVTLPETIKELAGGRVRRVLTTGTDVFKESAVGKQFDRLVMPHVSSAFNDIKDAPLGQLGARIKRMITPDTEVEVMVNGSAGQRMQAVDSFSNFMRNVFPDATDDAYRTAVTSRVQRLLTNPMTEVENIDDAGNVVTKVLQMPQTRAGVREVEDVVYEVISEYMKRGGASDAWVNEVLQGLKGRRGLARTYAIDAMAMSEDYTLAQRLWQDGLLDLDQIATEMTNAYGVPISPQDIRFIGPAAIQELYNHTLNLPNWRELRQMVENPFLSRIIRRPDTGDQRVLAAILDHAANKVWKPITLANPGYLMRNIIDGQTRLWMGYEDTYSLFNRPWRYLKVVRGKAGVEDILNKPMTREQLEALAGKTLQELTPAERDLVNVARAANWGSYSDAIASLDRMVKSGGVKIVNKASTQEYSRSVMDAVRKINADPLERVLSRIMGIADPATRKQIVLNYLLRTPEGEYIQSELLAAFERGVRAAPVGSYPANIKELIKLNLDTPDKRMTFWSGYIDTAIAGRVELMSEVPELRAMISHNVLPVLDKSGMAKAVTTVFPPNGNFMKSVRETTPFASTISDELTGAIYKNPTTGEEFFITAAETLPSGNIQVQMIELQTEQIGSVLKPVTAWTPNSDAFNPTANRTIRQLLARNDLTPNFPETLPSFERGATGPVAQGWRNVVDAVFVRGFGRIENAMEKLPTYRQFKWQIYENHYDALSKEAIDAAVANVEEGATRLNMSPDDYMGGVKGRFAKLQERANSVPAGKVGYSLDDLDNYSSSLALYRMKELFYDVPQKLNFETTYGIGIMYQFLAATRTILTDQVRLLAKNPMKGYRIARAFNSTTELDLPGETERGLVYTNPVTGQYVFRHPLGYAGRALFNALPGNDIGSTITPVLEAPVRGLNIGVSGVPNANAFGQVALAGLFDATRALFGQNDEIDGIRKVLMPFESLQAEKTLIERLSPSWANRLYNAMSLSMGRTTAMMSREILDAGSALAASGNYDLNNPTEIERLESDAKELAVIMTVLGAVSQAAGPASGNPDYFVQLKGIDIPAAVLARELQILKEQDYESATSRFVELFGDDAMVYVVGKTTTSKDAKGVLLTQKYLNWVRDNQVKVDIYPSGVGYYFGPADEDEFSFAARTYLIQTGKTRYRTIQDRIAAAQYAVGSTKYRAVRDKLPTFLNKEQQKILRDYRQSISAQYRGYVAPSYDVAQFGNTIKDLEDILQSGQFDQSPLTQYVKAYLGHRQELLGVLGQAGFSSFRSKAATPARQALDKYGEELARLNPEFARLYDRVLSAETDPAGTDPEIQP